MKLNLGVGIKPIEDFEGVDKKDYGQKYIFDLEKLWELESDSVDEIYCSHLLEHIKDINFFMSELYRCMKKGSQVTFFVPHYSWEGAFRDPSHVRFFTENTFNYFNKEYAKNVDYDMEYEFNFKVETNFTDERGYPEVKAILIKI